MDTSLSGVSSVWLCIFQLLNEYYNKWIEGYTEGPLLIINVDENKFGEREEDFGKIISKIDAQLYGLF